VLVLFPTEKFLQSSFVLIDGLVIEKEELTIWQELVQNGCHFLCLEHDLCRQIVLPKEVCVC